MRILVTNDDGYMATGIRVLADAMREVGDVDVVAPDREQSATSHSLTMHYPLRVRHPEDRLSVVDGTPTDCVMLAIGELLKDDRPDVVVSGVNHGANLGDDVLYSGTVAAAMEATILGIPSIAVSHVGREHDDLPRWREPLVQLIGQILERDDFPDDTVLNVNLPPVAPGEVKGVRVTTLARRAYIGSLTRALDPNGREYFWIGGGESKWWGRGEQHRDTDYDAVRGGYISITPLHLDLTNYELLKEIGEWQLSL
ncbi:MAG: 5'/3'-nucleotidase SurE [Longimicrobiales bacterium]